MTTTAAQTSQAPALQVVAGTGAAPADFAEVRARVMAEMADNDLSQNRVAKEAQISPTALSQFLNGTYQGNYAAVAAKLTAWLNDRLQRNAMSGVMPPAPSWVETPTAKRIYEGLAWAQMGCDIVVGYGGAGLGKSTTARRYQREHANVFIAECTPATASVPTMLQEIGIALDLRDMPLHPARLQRAIVDRLRGTLGLLILDDAQTLTHQALEQVRRLHDRAEIGIVLLGNEQIYTRITGGSRSEAFAPLFSRVGKRIRLSKPRAEDVKALAGAWSITGADEIKVLTEIAAKAGALRSVTKVIRLAFLSAAGAGKKVTAAHLRAAQASLAAQGGEDAE
jgi:DNA transposition AAA+ family ATPase